MDVVKLIASILVVMIHTQPFIATPFNYYVFSLCTLGVPYFFVMSSYFYYKNGESLKYFMRILQLYAVWFLIELPLVYVRFFNNDDIVAMNVGQLLWKFVTGSTFPVSWYLMASLEGVALVRLLQRWLSNFGLMVFAISLYVLCLLSSSYSFMVESDTWNTITGVISFGNSFFVGVIYIVTGKVLAETGGMKVLSKAALWLMLVVFFILWIIEISLVKGDYINTGCFVCLPIFTMMLASLSVRLKFDLNDSVCRMLRKSSTLIYLSHPVVIFLLGYLFGAESGLLLFTATFMLCGLFAVIVHNMSFRFGWLKYLY